MSYLYCVSVPERVSVSSTSSVPPLIETDDASVPASSSFMDPPVTVIPPDKVIPEAMETGVVWLSTVIELSRSLLSAGHT